MGVFRDFVQLPSFVQKVVHSATSTVFFFFVLGTPRPFNKERTGWNRVPMTCHACRRPMYTTQKDNPSLLPSELNSSYFLDKVYHLIWHA